MLLAPSQVEALLKEAQRRMEAFDSLLVCFGHGEIGLRRLTRCGVPPGGGRQAAHGGRLQQRDVVRGRAVLRRTGRGAAR